MLNTWTNKTTSFITDHLKQVLSKLLKHIPYFLCKRHNNSPTQIHACFAKYLQRIRLGNFGRAVPNHMNYSKRYIPSPWPEKLTDLHRENPGRWRSRQSPLDCPCTLSQRLTENIQNTQLINHPTPLWMRVNSIWVKGIRDNFLRFAK